MTKKGKEGLLQILDLFLQSSVVMSSFQLNSKTVQLIVELSDKKHMVLILYHGLASREVCQRGLGV